MPHHHIITIGGMELVGGDIVLRLELYEEAVQLPVALCIQSKRTSHSTHPACATPRASLGLLLESSTSAEDSVQQQQTSSQASLAVSGAGPLSDCVGPEHWM